MMCTIWQRWDGASQSEFREFNIKYHCKCNVRNLENYQPQSHALPKKARVPAIFCVCNTDFQKTRMVASRPKKKYFLLQKVKSFLKKSKGHQFFPLMITKCSLIAFLCWSTKIGRLYLIKYKKKVMSN